MFESTSASLAVNPRTYKCEVTSYYLIARVTQKAEQYEITENKTTPKDAESINGHLLTDAEKNQRKALIEKIQADGFEQVMEEVAYTWFNRFTALRFMEVNDYLPSHTRVFTNEAGEFKPQILADAIQLDLEGIHVTRCDWELLRRFAIPRGVSE